MTKRGKHTVFSNGDAAAAWGLRWWSERARQRDRARDDAELISELRWQWRSACAATCLAQMIYTPSGATRAVPMIAHVDLGPPISFTVRVRPGQRLADFVAAAPSIAPALNATALDIALITPGWVRVVLQQAPLAALPGGSFEPEAGSLKFGA
jgi:hypothetical protein